MRPYLAALVLLSLAQPSPARAQATARTALESLRMGTVVRVQLEDSSRVTGIIRALAADSLVLGRRAAPRALVIDRIASIDRRRGSSGRGALAGAAVGGLGMFVYSTMACDQQNHDECFTGYVTLAGAALGAVLGTVVGAFVPRWERVYPPR